MLVLRNFSVTLDNLSHTMKEVSLFYFSSGPKWMRARYRPYYAYIDSRFLHFPHFFQSLRIVDKLTNVRQIREHADYTFMLELC